MAISARKLKESGTPERTKLYEVSSSRSIAVNDGQKDGSVDRVILEYCVQEDEAGYFAYEYRPDDVPKEGSKLIDITAVMLNHAKRRARWHLYDIKGALAGENTVVQLCNQWNAGLKYLRQNILDQVPGYSAVPDLGVVTRSYDEERMKRLRDDCQRRCDEIENASGRMPLPQRKKRLDIVKCRAKLRASQAILDRAFRAEEGMDTYEIRIRLLRQEGGQVYKMIFPV